MSSTIVANLKLLLLIIGKSGTREQDCPVSATLYGTMIDYIFSDPSRHPSIISKYRENRATLDALLAKKGQTFDAMCEQRNRMIFEHIDLFPSWVMDKYGSEISWFSRFLRDRMEDRLVNALFRYVEAIEKVL